MGRCREEHTLVVPHVFSGTRATTRAWPRPTATLLHTVSIPRASPLHTVPVGKYALLTTAPHPLGRPGHFSTLNAGRQALGPPVPGTARLERPRRPEFLPPSRSPCAVERGKLVNTPYLPQRPMSQAGPEPP